MNHKGKIVFIRRREPAFSTSKTRRTRGKDAWRRWARKKRKKLGQGKISGKIGD